MEPAAFREWESSDDPVKRAHVANVRRIKAGIESAPPLPSLAEQASSFAGAIVSAVASGGRRVSAEERARRLEICRTCEHLDGDTVKCRKCGCHLPWKARLASWHCPIKKW